jgi:hypothetical protein
MHQLIIPPEVKEQIKLCVDNIRYLMFKILHDVPKEMYDRVYNAFKTKMKTSVYTILNWYKTYVISITDSFLMIIEQEIKMNQLKNNINNRIQLLNYDIQKELYHYMNRVYNLYPNR